MKYNSLKRLFTSLLTLMIAFSLLAPSVHANQLEEMAKDLGKQVLTSSVSELINQLAAAGQPCKNAPFSSSKERKKEYARLPPCAVLRDNFGSGAGLSQQVAQMLQQQIQQLIEKALSGGGGGGGGGGGLPDYTNYAEQYAPATTSFYNPPSYPVYAQPDYYSPDSYNPYTTEGSNSDGETSGSSGPDSQDPYPKAGATPSAYYECKGGDCSGESGSDSGNTDTDDAENEAQDGYTGTNDDRAPGSGSDDGSYINDDVYGYIDSDGNVYVGSDEGIFPNNQAGSGEDEGNALTETIYNGQRVVFLGPEGYDRIIFDDDAPIPDNFPFDTEAGYLDGVAGYVYGGEGPDEYVFVTVQGGENPDFAWEDVEEEDGFWGRFFDTIKSPFVFLLNIV